jgi:hypothetical protein
VERHVRQLTPTHTNSYRLTLAREILCAPPGARVHVPPFVVGARRSPCRMRSTIPAEGVAGESPQGKRVVLCRESAPFAGRYALCRQVIAPEGISSVQQPE